MDRTTHESRTLVAEAAIGRVKDHRSGATGVAVNNLSFHHFGVACRDIDREAAVYTSLGYTQESLDFEDPMQGVSGRFLIGGGPRIELLAALPGSVVLEPWMTSGSRIYHQAFETPDLDAALARLCEDRARVMVEPVPAVAFDGRNICFLMLRNMALIELIQAV